MRVLCVSSWFPYPPDNGSKRRAYSLIRELARTHQTTLVTFAEPGEGERGLGDLEPRCHLAGVVVGNPARSPGSLPTLSLLSSWPRSFRAGYRLEMQRLVDLRLRDHEAVVAFQPGAALYLLGRRSIPWIFDEPEVTVIRERFLREPCLVPRARRGLTWWKYGRFIRRLAVAADRTSVVSDLERAQIVGLGCPADRVAVVPNGADVEPEERSPDVEADTLVYAGALTYSANLDAVTWFLDNVWTLVLRERPSARLFVTGATSGQALDGVSRAPHVTFTGHLEDARQFTATRTAAIVPLRVGGGTRLKVLEALAVGTPVVATSKGVEGLAVTHGLDVLLADTPRQFADQVLHVLGDAALRARLARNGRALVADRYTWSAAGLRLTRLIEDARDSFGRTGGARSRPPSPS